MKKIKQWIEKWLPVRRVVVSVKVVCEYDEVLETLLAQGPESHVWRGMDECMRRLMQRWEDDATGTLEEKGLAIVRGQALMELRSEMMTLFHARQRKLENNK